MALISGLNDGECGLTDGSIEGDWHLESKEELQGIGTDPPTTWVTNLPSIPWTIPAATFVDVQSDYYWLSTEYDTDNAWVLGMPNSHNGFTSKTAPPDCVVIV